MDITARFKGAEVMPLLQSLPICVVGNGGIGSHFLMTMTKAGPKEVFNYEYDVVEVHNLGGQLFNKEQVGDDKATAILETCSEFNGYSRFNQLGKFKETSGTLPIMFMCVDKNSVRKIALEQWIKNAEENNWLHTIVIDGVEHTLPYVMIDGRISFSKLNLFVITKDTAKFHLSHKLPLEESETTPDCTTKSNPFVGPTVANLMVSTYFNFLQNTIDYNSLGLIAREVPYLLEFDFYSNTLTKTDVNDRGIWNYNK